MSVIVFGVRSGTSMLTRIINLMGLNVGTQNKIMTPCPTQNPKGFWENMDILNLNNKIINSLGREWWNVSSSNVNDISLKLREEFKIESKRILANIDVSGNWIIKDPRFSFTYPLWEDDVSGAVHIIAYRNPIEVAKSLSISNGFPLEFSMALWEFYFLNSVFYSKGRKVLMINYCDIIEEPVKMTQQIFNDLEYLNSGQIKMPNINILKSFIDKDLYIEKTDQNTEEKMFDEYHKELWIHMKNKNITSICNMVTPERYKYLNNIMNKTYEKRL